MNEISVREPYVALGTRVYCERLLIDTKAFVPVTRERERLTA